MVKKLVTVFACDLCGKPALRYLVQYSDGNVRALDRCTEHGRALEKFRLEAGAWL